MKLECALLMIYDPMALWTMVSAIASALMVVATSALVWISRVYPPFPICPGEAGLEFWQVWGSGWDPDFMGTAGLGNWRVW